MYGQLAVISKLYHVWAARCNIEAQPGTFELESSSLPCLVRASYNGITLAFQADDVGSIPTARSKFARIAQLDRARPS